MNKTVLLIIGMILGVGVLYFIVKSISGAFNLGMNTINTPSAGANVSVGSDGSVNVGVSGIDI